MSMQQGHQVGPDPGRRSGAAVAQDDRPISEHTAAPSRHDDDLLARERRPVMRDRIRWGPVWAGLVVALATYLLLQLVLVAVDAVEVVDPSTGDAQEAAGMALAGIAGALVAATVGGAIGAKMWPRHEDVIDLRDPQRTATGVR